jgi:hypothetical protein
MKASSAKAPGVKVMSEQWERQQACEQDGQGKVLETD